VNTRNNDPDDPWIYFGVWSAAQIARVSQLLKDSGVEFRVDIEEQSEERLKKWTAWDPAAENPREGHELWIHARDIDKVGKKIAEMYPERNFGAP
jgi:hypothetical protein